MAEPSIAMIPSGYKANKVFSVLPTDGSGDLDFARTTKATRVNQNGLIEEVAIGVPRLDYTDGGCPSLLLEPASTNLITYSEDFSQWTKGQSNGTVTILSSTEISPKGSADAYKVKFTLNDLNTGEVNLNVGTISGLSGALTVSYYLKADEPTQIMIRNPLNNGVYSFIDLTTEWKRYELSTPTSSTLFVSIGLRNLQSNTNLSSTVYISEAQLEAQSYATSYIPTNGGIETRLAETCNGAGTSDTFNDSEGVLMAEINYQNINTNWSGFGLMDSNGDPADRVIFAVQANTQNLNVYIQSGGIVRWNTAVVIDASQYNKISIKYKSNDNALWINGFEVATDSAASIMPSGLEELRYFGYGSSEPTYGKTKQLQYFDTALTDSELETLTSWVSFQEMAQSQNYTIQ